MKDYVNGISFCFKEYVEIQGLQRILFILQGISGDLGERQHLVDELQSLAKPLIESCDANVALHIQEAVQEAETAWNGTCDNLRELCTKYQRAVNLWKQYREASDAVKNWADEQIGTFGTLQPLDAIKHVEVSFGNNYFFLNNFI